MINIITSPCGSGKTAAMMRIMNNSPEEQRWLYITPLLSEADQRVAEEVPNRTFHCPDDEKGSKLEDLSKLLKNKVDISTTHALFHRITPEIANLVVSGGYNIVVDEALSAVGVASLGLNSADVKALFTSGMVSIDRGNRDKVVWNEALYPKYDGKYGEVRQLSRLGMLYSYKDSLLMFEYPPKLFNSYLEVWVLTYLFDGSAFRCWMDLNDAPYKIVDNDELGILGLKEAKAKIRSCIEVVSSGPLDKLQKRQRSTAFSHRWLDNCDKDTISKYRTIMLSCVRRDNIRANNLFWTTYKSSKKKLESNGFKADRDSDEPCFLPVNIRATNDYMHKTFCIYAANPHYNPIDVNYLTDSGVRVNKDLYALGECIQFVWRGCCRRGERMKVLILSDRIRKLFDDWLERDDI